MLSSEKRNSNTPRKRALYQRKNCDVLADRPCQSKCADVMKVSQAQWILASNWKTVTYPLTGEGSGGSGKC